MKVQYTGTWLKLHERGAEDILCTAQTGANGDGSYGRANGCRVGTSAMINWSRSVYTSMLSSSMTWSLPMQWFGLPTEGTHLVTKNPSPADSTWVARCLLADPSSLVSEMQGDSIRSSGVTFAAIDDATPSLLTGINDPTPSSIVESYSVIRRKST